MMKRETTNGLVDKKHQWKNNEDLIHRQLWIAQQGMANNNDYFVVQYNDIGFTDYVPKDYRPELYGGQYGQLTWVVNE